MDAGEIGLGELRLAHQSDEQGGTSGEDGDALARQKLKDRLRRVAWQHNHGAPRIDHVVQTHGCGINMEQGHHAKQALAVGAGRNECFALADVRGN